MVRIGQLYSFSSGHGFRKQDWYSGGLPIIRIQNLNDSKEFNYFDGETDPKWMVLAGDLLFAWTGVKGVSFGPKILMRRLFQMSIFVSGLEQKTSAVIFSSFILKMAA